MNKTTIRTLKALVEQQLGGSREAEATIRGLNLSLPDGYCLANLYGEWRGAFSFPPGRNELLPAFVRLLGRLCEFEKDDTLELYRAPEWEELVAARGPVETVITYSCRSCRSEYVAMGTSGFYDANGLLCRSCGDVYFKSYYDETETPPCRCGGTFSGPEDYGCPKCGHRESKIKREISPYEYFSRHGYRRGPGA